MFSCIGNLYFSSSHVLKPIYQLLPKPYRELALFSYFVLILVQKVARMTKYVL